MRTSKSDLLPSVSKNVGPCLQNSNNQVQKQLSARENHYDHWIFQRASNKSLENSARKKKPVLKPLP